MNCHRHSPSYPPFCSMQGRTTGPPEMSGKGKRRSARLLKLEEQKNDGDSAAAVCLLDPWQIIRNSIAGSSARGKRKRNGEIQQLQGEASCSHHQPLAAVNGNNLPIQSSVGQIIEYILDELELRDRHELFAMPDDIQAADYAERVSRPGDFATLRQKNKDGMYTALEQFENDVYMVFQKAITMNSQDTVPFREAMALLDQAKHVFMSLKNNRMYSESELAAWRLKHLDQPQQPITPDGREGGNRAPSRHTAATPLQQSTATPRKAKKPMNAANTGGNIPENQRAGQRGAKDSKGTPPAKKPRKAAMAGFGRAAGMVARRRLTYNDEPAADQGWQAMATAMASFQGRHVTLCHQPQGDAYRGSLQRFVRHTGLKARVAAEFRTLECVARARHSPSVSPQCWSGFAPGAGFLPPSPRPLGAAAPEAMQQARPPSAADMEPAPPECKLETDEVLKLFVLMATPAAFLGRAKKVFGEGEREEGATKEGQAGRAAGDARVGDASAAETEQGKKSGASEQSAAACGPFAPPKLVPGRLGFGQFAASPARPFKLKSKPPTSSASGKKKAA